MNPKNINKKRILAILTGFGTGGSERLCVNLAETTRNEYEWIFVGVNDGPLRSYLQDIGVKTYVVNKSRGIDFKLCYKLFKIIKSERIDIVFSHHFMPLFYSFIPTKISFNKHIHVEHSVWELTKLSKFYSNILNFMLNRIDYCISISEELFNFFVSSKSLDIEKLAKIINGIPIEKFEVKGERLRIRQQYNISDNDFLIGSIGNLRPEKNHVMQIKALPLLIRNHKNIKLMLVGDGSTKGQLQKLALSLGVKDHVIFTGSKPDASIYYEAFDVYLLTSLFEGLPLTVLEAMAAKKPIIATDVIGINEVVKNDYNGFLVELDNVEELTTKLIVVMNSNGLFDKIVENAFETVKQKYSMSQCAAHYTKLFNSLQ